MEAKELMINDLVYRKEHEEFHKRVQWSVVKIDGVMDNCITIAPDSEFLNMDEVEPILLTAEILLKSNIARAGYDRYYVGKDLYVKWYDNDTFGLGKMNDSYKEPIFDYFASVNYVHELQHALRLAGLNEVANNLKV